jgi:hypothetical protein
VISCITASFVLYFDVITHKEDANGGTSRSSSFIYSSTAFLTISFLGLLWPIATLLFFTGVVQSLIMIIFSIAFYVVAAVAHGMRHQEESELNNR